MQTIKISAVRAVALTAVLALAGGSAAAQDRPVGAYSTDAVRGRVSVVAFGGSAGLSAFGRRAGLGWPAAVMRARGARWRRT